MGDIRTRRLVWILIGIVLFFLASAVVNWLWNRIIPWVIGFPPITYWQAAGLLLLTRILFGGFAGRFFTGAGRCSCGCSDRINPELPLSATDTDAMTTDQKRDYLIRNRAFLNEIDDR